MLNELQEQFKTFTRKTQNLPDHYFDVDLNGNFTVPAIANQFHVYKELTSEIEKLRLERNMYYSEMKAVSFAAAVYKNELEAYTCRTEQAIKFISKISGLRTDASLPMVIKQARKALAGLQNLKITRGAATSASS